MAEGRIECWLRARQKRKSHVHGVTGIVMLVLSLPALVLTYIGISVAYEMTVSSLKNTFCLPIPSSALEYTGIASLVILALCFPCYLTANHEDLQDLKVSTGTASDEVMHVHFGTTCGSTINPLAPNTIRSFIKLITSVLLVAPALFLNGCSLLAKARHVRTLGFADAARVLGVLANHYHRVSYGEIMEAVPGIDPTRTFPELARVEGVVVLSSEPPGLSVNDELRAQLQALID